jgi:hypothetical protein
VYKTLSLGSKSLYALRACVLLLLARGLAGDDLIKAAHLRVLGKIAATIAALLSAIGLLDRAAARNCVRYSVHRVLSLLLGIATFVTVIVAVCWHGYFWSYFVSLYYAGAALGGLGLLCGGQ